MSVCRHIPFYCFYVRMDVSPLFVFCSVGKKKQQRQQSNEFQKRCQRWEYCYCWGVAQVVGEAELGLKWEECESKNNFILHAYVEAGGMCWFYCPCPFFSLQWHPTTDRRTDWMSNNKLTQTNWGQLVLFLSFSVVFQFAQLVARFAFLLSFGGKIFSHMGDKFGNKAICRHTIRHCISCRLL